MCTDVCWCVLMCSDVYWCVLMRTDVHWCDWCVLCAHKYWCVLVCTGVYWCALMCTIVYWCVLMRSDVYWCVLMCTDVYWCVLMCTDAYWCALICTNGYWCVLMCTDVYWCVLMGTDVYWCVLMCNVYWCVQVCRRLIVLAADGIRRSVCPAIWCPKVWWCVFGPPAGCHGEVWCYVFGPRLQQPCIRDISIKWSTHLRKSTHDKNLWTSNPSKHYTEEQICPGAEWLQHVSLPASQTASSNGFWQVIDVKPARAWTLIIIVSMYTDVYWCELMCIDVC